MQEGRGGFQIPGFRGRANLLGRRGELDVSCRCVDVVLGFPAKGGHRPRDHALKPLEGPLGPSLPDLSYLHLLRRREARDSSHHAFVEGVRFLIRAVESGARVLQAVAAPGMLRSESAWRVLRRLEAARVPVLRISPQEFRALSSAREPQGVGLLIEQVWTPLASAPAGRQPLWVAFEHVRSPGNLGTILRTCEATGVDGVMLLGDSTDPYDPDVVRASMGSLFGVRLSRAGHEEAREWFRRTGAYVVGASAEAFRDHRTVDYRRPVVLMIGCERRGLSPLQEDLCDKLVRIPMAGGVDSLNVAAATAVLLYEVFGQRHPPAGRQASLARGPGRTENRS